MKTLAAVLCLSSIGLMLAGAVTLGLYALVTGFGLMVIADLRGSSR